MSTPIHSLASAVGHLEESGLCLASAIDYSARATNCQWAGLSGKCQRLLHVNRTCIDDGAHLLTIAIYKRSA